MPRLIELSAVGKEPPCSKLAPAPAIPHAAGGAIPSEALNPPKPPRVCACSPLRSRVTGVVLSFRTDFWLSLLPILVQPARRDAAALSPSPGPSTSPPPRPQPGPQTLTPHIVPSSVPSPVPSLRHRTPPPVRPQPGPHSLRHRAVPRGSRAAGGAKALPAVSAARGSAKHRKYLNNCLFFFFFFKFSPSLSLFNSV